MSITTRSRFPVPPRWRKEVESVLITDKMLAKRIAELGREIERDFAVGGRGAGMVEDIDRAIDGAIASGKVTPLGKGLSMRSNRK